MKFKTGQAVRVVWRDHAHGKHGWHSPDKLPTRETIVTYGVIMAVKRKHIVVASSVGLKKNGSVNLKDSITHTTAILKSCIAELTRL